MVERSRGRFLIALQFTDQALKIAPNEPESWYQKGKILSVRGDSVAALDAYDRALELNPRLVRVHLGRASEQSGDPFGPLP